MEVAATIKTHIRNLY
ncbi:MAG: hypothetical protein ACLRP3_09440 [Escherichia sp.]